MAKPCGRTEAGEEQGRDPGLCTVKAFSGKTPSAFRQSASGVHPAEPARKAPESGCPSERRDPTRLKSGKATVAWVACFSTRLGHEAQPAGRPRQGHPANHATRECDDHDE